RRPPPRGGRGVGPVGSPPPRPPPNPPPAAGAGGVPFGPQPVVSVLNHFRLRFLTVAVLTSLSALYRLPLKSPEYERHSSARGLMMAAGSSPPVSAPGRSGEI